MRFPATSRWLAGTAAIVLACAGTGLATATPSAASTHKVSTHTSLAGVHAVAGRTVTLSATVHPNPHGGTVRFVVNGRSTLHGCSAVHLHSGKARCHAKLVAGSRSLHASFSGHKKFLASTTRRTVRVVATPTPAAKPTPKPTAAKTGTFVGSLGGCTTSKGALVAVDFKKWSGPIVRGCDTTPTTGIELLITAKFTTVGDKHDGPQFICRIGNSLFNSGTQYPTAAQDACVVTPPASAYWSYWLAPKGANTWTYSQFGAYSQKASTGEVEAWTFGGTDVAGATGKPSFTPNQARAGLPTGTTAATPQIKARTAKVRSKALVGRTSPDLTTAADYLVKNLTDGEYYDPYGTGSDIGLTIDGAYALAASGTRDAAVTKIVDYVKAHQNDYTFLTGQYADYAGGGYVGKVGLLAEVVGDNPRSFGGVNLIDGLDRLICTKSVAGKCAAQGNFDYTPSTFGQVLGILAQLRAGDSTGAAKPIAYLESLQHSSGAFPSVLPGTDSETDSTGMAAMGLALVPGAKARSALAKALKWLAGRQESSGGFPGASGDSVNSAAIAVQALRLDAQNYAGQIVKAEKFLAGEQNTDGGFNVAVGAEANGSDLRASTQALSGAVGTPFGSVLDNLASKTIAGKGADYLVSQLTDGTHYESGGYVDYGGSADSVFGLIATGGHASDVTKMVHYLADNVDGYADTSKTYGGPYAGSLAKLALVAEASGVDPHDFGGTDLLQLLASKVCTAAIPADQNGSTPCTAAGDFYNAFSPVSQALGVLALQASPTDATLTATSPVVVRLQERQCADGGFSSQLVEPKNACTSDPDTTGFAVQALATVPGTDTWLGAAQVYLQKTQLTSGLYNGAVKSSSNSTALAADALQSLTGALTSATADPPQPKAITPIVAWQSALTGLNTLAVSTGGFQIASSTSGTDLRASTQAVAAAAQRTLLNESGATIRSLPRIADTTMPPRTSSPTSSPTKSHSGSTSSSSSAAAGSGSSTNAGGSTQGSGSLASTGLDAGSLLRWALALLVLGAGLTLVGRRRAAGAVRPAARHR